MFPKTLRIFDSEAQKHSPSSKRLTRPEYNRVYPDRPPRVFSLIFKYQSFCIVEREIAYAFLRKFKSLSIVDENFNRLAIQDDLDMASIKYLRLILSKNDIPWVGWTQIQMIDRLRSFLSHCGNPVILPEPPESETEPAEKPDLPIKTPPKWRKKRSKKIQKKEDPFLEQINHKTEPIESEVKL